MSFIDDAMKIGEEQAAPEGTYDLRIDDCEVRRTSNDDRDMFCPRIRIESPESYKTIFEYLVIPNSEDMAKMDQGQESPAEMFIRNIKRFAAVFGLEITDLFPDGDTPDAEALKGATGSCLLIQEEYEGNINNKLRAPRLKE